MYFGPFSELILNLCLAARPKNESKMGPRQSLRKRQDSRENTTNWFPEGPDIKCSVTFLDFQFNVLQQQQKNML